MIGRASAGLAAAEGAATADLIRRSLSRIPDSYPPEALAQMESGTQGPLTQPLVPAAVLVPLFARAGEWRVILTERAAKLARHPGQIAFPGGRIETTDPGPLQAALREAAEEIGLSSAIVEPAGYLATHVTITGYAVVPVVGFIRGTFSMCLDPAEVSAAFDAPLAHLLEPANHREVIIGGGRKRVWEIMYQEHRIWGATAAMLVDFSRRLTACGYRFIK